MIRLGALPHSCGNRPSEQVRIWEDRLGGYLLVKAEMSACNYTITSRKAGQSVGPSKDEKSPSRWALWRNDGVALFKYWSYVQIWWEIIFLIRATIYLASIPKKNPTSVWPQSTAYPPVIYSSSLFLSQILSSGIVWWYTLFWALFAWGQMEAGIRK